MSARAASIPGGLRAVQYLLLAAGEVAWLAAWDAALGAWLGGAREPLLGPGAVALLLALAALATRLALGRSETLGLARIALVLLGLVVTVLAALAELPALRSGWDWAAARDQLARTVYGGRAVLTGALALVIWWRGLVLGRERPSLWVVEGKLRIGILALGAALAGVALAGLGAAPAASSLIVPALVLVFAGLVGMPLVRIVDESGRPRHQGGSALVPGGPWLAMLLGVVGGLLFLTLLLSQVFTFERIVSLFEPLGGLLEALLWALLYAIALPVGLLAEALIYLGRLLLGPGGPSTPPPQPLGLGWLEELRQQQRSGAVAPELLIALKAGIVVALGLVVALLLARTVLRLRARWEEDDVAEVRELAWDWPGLSAIWRLLLAWLSRGVARSARAVSRWRADPAVPRSSATSVRELYRQFLTLGASVGRARQTPETPLEYERRLEEDDSLEHTAEIRSITEIYVRVRYGPPFSEARSVGAIAAALARLRSLWESRLRR